MLQRVTVDGLELPRLYIAENKADVELALENGIPFIKWKKGQHELLRCLLRPTLEKMFPGINWVKVLGKKKKFDSFIYNVPGTDDVDQTCEDLTDIHYDSNDMLEAQLKYDQEVDAIPHDQQEPDENGVYSRPVDSAESTRVMSGGVEGQYEDIVPDGMDVFDYIGDLSSSVDIDVLQKLGMLPKFIGDITNCIKFNLSNRMRWTEGYTKKLGVPLGNFKSNNELPNLIIIDISHSIPDGIASTMITLADTLREQCNAELIITSARSGYYPIGSELPSPQTLRDYYGRSNEGFEFQAILRKYISGREFGNVISFGDYDSPYFFYGFSKEKFLPEMTGTKVHAVHHFHTREATETGYAVWVKQCCPDVEEHFDTTWCSMMNKRYHM